MCGLSNNFSANFPLGTPTRFGLSGKKQGHWDEQVANADHGDFNTTYKVSYSAMQRDAACRKRFATPKEKSTTLLKLNSINKDLQLRGKVDFQSPEAIPNVQ